MGNGESSSRILVRSAQVCGLACTTIGAGAIIGSVTRQPFLLGIRQSYIPMAPNTAIGFLALGAAVFVVATDQSRLHGLRQDRFSSGSASDGETGWLRWARELAGVGALLVTLICVLRLAEFARAASFAVDSWFLRVPAGKLGGAPVGKMAFFTAIAFLAAGLALAILAWNRRPINQQPRNIAGAGATFTGAIGLVFTLGYLFSPDTPLLYGGDSIPMALNTAIGFVLLGTGLAAAAGPSSFPLHRVCGSSIRDDCSGYSCRWLSARW